MAFVAGGFQRVVQLAHALGGEHVDRVFLFEAAGLIAGDEAELAHVLLQILQRELGGDLAGFQVVQPETLEVADQQVARQLGVGKAMEIITRLRVCAVQILAARLVLDQQHALPQQVDVTVLAVEFLHLLLEVRHPPAADPEHIEKPVPERLRLGVFR